MTLHLKDTQIVNSSYVSFFAGICPPNHRDCDKQPGQQAAICWFAAAEWVAHTRSHTHIIDNAAYKLYGHSGHSKHLDQGTQHTSTFFSFNKPRSLRLAKLRAEQKYSLMSIKRSNNIQHLSSKCITNCSHSDSDLF